MRPSFGSDGVTGSGLPTGRRPEAMRIWLLDGFRASVGSRTIEGKTWCLRKAAALIKQLALAPGHRIRREQAMDLLWPDLGKRAASNNLRYALHATRRMTGVSAVLYVQVFMVGRKKEKRKKSMKKLYPRENELGPSTVLEA